MILVDILAPWNSNKRKEQQEQLLKNHVPVNLFWASKINNKSPISLKDWKNFLGSIGR